MRRFRDTLSLSYLEAPMFKDMLTDIITIRTGDGKTYANVGATVQTGEIFILRTDIPIKPGDEVVRRTPAGVDEVFVVEDPGFHAAFHSIPASYHMRVRRSDAPASASHGGTVIYNLTGPNARFNINSVDSSTNVVSQAPPEFFEALRLAIQSRIPAGQEQRDLLAAAAALEQQTGKPTFAQRYSQFMALAANHMEVLVPFIPALTQMLTGLLKG
jgi:hypothetical protein